MFLALGASALCFLGTRLAFVPVPWPDGSANYLPGMDLVHWPPRWRMHTQAAFIPSYDVANFNQMPLVPLLMGIAGHLPWLPGALGVAFLIRAVSLVALLGWVWLLWHWLIESLGSVTSGASRRARVAASLIAIAALWDPVLRWGTLVVRTEAWVGLCWLACLRDLYRWEENWPRAAWRISAALALSAHFHFEAVYFVPAVVVGLAGRRGWFARLAGVAWRSALLLSPWLLYVASHFGLFVEQMRSQFFRLAHGNHWMSEPYLIFHSLFLTLGNPVGWPKFFNLAKALFWLGLALMTAVTAGALLTRESKPARSSTRRMMLASAVAFASAFYLWATKEEAWFITLCHLTYWQWAGAALIWAWQEGKRELLFRRGLTGLAGAYALLSVVAGFAQARSISPGYTARNYGLWVDCIEQALGPLAALPDLRLWQPDAPDVLVELSRRHPGWDLTRALDFPERQEIASEAGRRMDAILRTQFFNPPRSEAEARYLGPLRDSDRELLVGGLEGREARVCQIGPFWAAVLSRNASSNATDEERGLRARR